mgnify:FL=1
MAGKGGKGGPWREFLDGMVVWLLVCVCVVVLVSSGAWNVISDKVGIGHAASTSGLTKAPDEAQRRADAKSITDLLAGLTGHKDTTPKTDAGMTTTPKTDAKSDAGAKTDTKAATGSWGSDPAVWQAGLDATNTIATAKARPGGYDRERYFGGWASNGCGSATTRDTILARDLKGAVENPRCQVTSGTLTDPYTGRTIQFRRGRNTSSAVQIDHVVALLDAWESGARDWDQTKRVQYANSTDVLLASDGPANMAKGSGLDVNGTALYRSQNSGAPDVWMPDNKAYRCDYMAKRATIKSKWGLTMTPREKQQTVSVLSQCVAGTYGN